MNLTDARLLLQAVTEQLEANDVTVTLLPGGEYNVTSSDTDWIARQDRWETRNDRGDTGPVFL